MDIYGGTHGVMVIIIGNEHGKKSSNPAHCYFCFT